MAETRTIYDGTNWNMVPVSAEMAAVSHWACLPPVFQALEDELAEARLP
jgi:hypothetical protein